MPNYDSECCLVLYKGFSFIARVTIVTLILIVMFRPHTLVELKRLLT